MKTQNKKLQFNTKSVVELQTNEMNTINGGTGTLYYPSVTVMIIELTKQMTCGGGEDTCVTRQ